MSDIKALSDRDHVRTRPGMYIGATDEPSVAVREIIDNSIDEILGGRADSIWVYSDQLVSDTGSKLMRYTVADNGGGIPIKATVNQSGEEITMTELGTGSLRAGSKFNKTEIQSGTHGVGTSVVMILSSEFQIYSRLSCTDLKLSTKWVQDEVVRLKLSSRKKVNSEYSDLDYYYYKLSYSDGYKVNEEIVRIDEDEILSKYFIDIHPSTVTSFIPHPDIWHTQTCKIPMNTRYLKYKCLKDGIETHFFINGEEIMDLPKSYDYEFKCRIDNKEVGTKNDFMEFYVSMGISERLDDPSKDYSVNTLSTQTGHHVRILNKAYEMAFESVFGDCNGAAGMGIDILCIFTCPEPSYSSQTKERLSDIPGFSVYAEYPRLVKAFVKVINENLEVFKANHERIIEYLRSKDNWSRLSEIKSKLMLAADTGGSHRSAYKPKGLKDCTCRDRTKAELILCFTGDTEILDCNNNRISFKDLTEMIKDGKSVYTLSCDEHGVKYPSKITWAGITGKSDKMVKVTLDNGTSFVCTPEHKIMMKDGSYKEAKDLLPNDSCMPIYISSYAEDTYNNTGVRRAVKCPRDSVYPFRPVYGTIDEGTNEWEYYIYRIMGMHKDVTNISDGTDIIHIHHMDHNPLNDYPNNLMKCNRIWHKAHHGAIGALNSYKNGKFNRFYGMDEDKRKSLSESGKAFYKTDEGERMKSHLSEVASKQWNNPELKLWKSKDNKRWALEHPEEAKQRSIKCADTSMRKRCIEITKYIDEHSLDHTYSNYDKIDSELHPTRTYSAEIMCSHFPEYFDTYIDDYRNKYIDYLIEIFTILKDRNLPLTKQNFSDINKELYGKPIRKDTYRNIHELYRDTFEYYESQLNDNHKVSSIEWITYNEPIDTYCLRVDNDLHNFPLANGIFVHNCEGRSALGSLTKARAGMNNIALLGLRGRPKNVSGMDITDVLENDEMYDLINAIGVGVNDYHSLDQVRYGKVIINSDGDADGLAIAALVLGTILEHMTFLIPAGMVYIARCPLYAQGDKYYYYGEEHLVDFSKPTKRWKGLGEMNPDELKKVSIDPNTRSLIKVTLDNIDYCRALLSSTTARKELMLGKGIITEDQLQPFNIMTDGNGDYDHDQ